MFKQFFKGWRLNLQGELRKKRKEFQAELTELETIEEEDGLNSSQIDRKVWLMCENLKSFEEEEIYWYERSPANGLLQGDDNTSFFINVQMEERGKTISSVLKKMVT